MRFQTPLVPAELLRRYKRFLADIRLDDGSEVTAHVANPGAMTGLAAPGQRIWVEPVDDPKRKLKFSWKLAETGGGGFTVVDTSLANRVVREALADGGVPALQGYDRVRPEQRYGTGSRIDFLLSGEGRPDAYVEVKSVTLSREPGLAEFPDSVTVRGARHLAELAAMAAEGHRAVMLYLVQRSDAAEVSLAEDVDPAYVRAFTAARDAGVEAIALGTEISPRGIRTAESLPFTMG